MGPGARTSHRSRLQGEHRAAYLLVADRLRQAIRAGEYTDGRQLPTEAGLATKHGLSRQTVRRAYLELVAEGLIDRVPGRGTFVADRDPKYLRHFGSVEDLMGLSIDTTIEIIEPLRRGVDIDAAARLGLTEDIVHSVRYVRAHLGVPFAVTRVSLPPPIASRVSDLAELTTHRGSGGLTVIGLLEAHSDIRITSADQTITAEPATDILAALLACSPGTSLLRIDRLFMTNEGAPVELSIGHFLPEQYTYRIALGRSGG